ncbi:MAG: nucleotidyltransferase domain-containing protein [Bacteroidetes bacterium]|nr:MAG: nucleotidyltransferase domain-containing protein [Bacteroidota bacterium]
MEKMQIIRKPIFPTTLHQDLAELIRDHFLAIPAVDTVLTVNSCARGQAVPESDLDVAILVKSDTTAAELKTMEHSWQIYLQNQPTFLKYRQSSPFAHLHLDIIDGNYTPAKVEKGEPIDYFEIEIGNQICYSAPMENAGFYFQTLQSKWLPYYNEELRLQRLQMTKDACNYDLDHIPFFIKRELYFQAFDILCKAFQEYLQALFIANKTYPIAYNKWIKEQVIKWLNKPDLYPELSPILSISNIESNEINDRVKDLRRLLSKVT